MMLGTTELITATGSEDELLRRYVRENDRDALAELVRRYADIVYAAAMRLVRRGDLAEDVSQAVFIAFARRAGQIKSGAAVGAWLLTATRFVASNTMKSEMRRQRHEIAAAGMRGELLNSDPLAREWEGILPRLDEAIARLSLADQAAVVLRYFRGLSLREVATATGTTEEGARKRVSRAIGRLRVWLGASDEVTLGLLLSSRGVEQMPGEVLSRAMLATASVQPVAVVLSGVAKIAAGVLVAMSLLGGGYAVHLLADHSSAVAGPLLGAASQPTTAPADDWQSRFEEVYGLAPDQNVKYVPPPFIAERERFSGGLKGPPGPFQLFIRQYANGKLVLNMAMSGWVFPGGADGNSRPYTIMAFGHGPHGTTSGMEIVDLAAQLANVSRSEIFEDPGLAAQVAPGDWVVRNGANSTEILKGVVSEWSRQSGQKLTLLNNPLQQEVIVVSGRSNQQRQPTTRLGTIVRAGEAVAGAQHYILPRRIRVKDMANVLSFVTGFKCIDQTQAGPDVMNQIGEVAAPEPGHVMADAALNDLLKELGDQTGLTFKREQRKLDQWTIGTGN